MNLVDSKFIGLVSSRLEKFKKVKSNLYNFRCPICGALAIISFIVSPIGQKILTNMVGGATISAEQTFVNGSN